MHGWRLEPASVGIRIAACCSSVSTEVESFRETGLEDEEGLGTQEGNSSSRGGERGGGGVASEAVLASVVLTAQQLL